MSWIAKQKTLTLVSEEPDADGNYAEGTFVFKSPSVEDYLETMNIKTTDEMDDLNAIRDAKTKATREQRKDDYGRKYGSRHMSKMVGLVRKCLVSGPEMDGMEPTVYFNALTPLVQANLVMNFAELFKMDDIGKKLKKQDATTKPPSKA